MINILCVDGGGIRGIGPAYLLKQLDAALKSKGGVGVADSFDLFVGTSTGCILAAGLAAQGQALMPTDPQALFDLYYQRGAQMFTRTPWSAPSFDLVSGMYQTKAKSAVLDTILGDLTLGQLNRNFMGTYYSMRPTPQAVFPQGGPKYREIPDNYYAATTIAAVVNASSNAPIYFDPSAVPGPSDVASLQAVDGGVFANNPAVCAVVEVMKKWEVGLDEIRVVSLGCGSQKTAFPPWSHWGLLHWASPQNGVPILEVILGAQAEIVEHQMEQLLEKDKTYFRLQFDLTVPAPIDVPDKGNLDAIVAAAAAYLSADGKKTFDGVVSALLTPKGP